MTYFNNSILLNCTTWVIWHIFIYDWPLSFLYTALAFSATETSSFPFVDLECWIFHIITKSCQARAKQCSSWLAAQKQKQNSKIFQTEQEKLNKRQILHFFWQLFNLANWEITDGKYKKIKETVMKKKEEACSQISFTVP